MENKKEIVKRLKELLVVTRAGEDILDLVLDKKQENVTIVYKNGHFKKVNIEAGPGVAIIKDITSRL
ncbi:MAG: hypothetical protein HFH68_17115 [Lachnospiraceae bacterium]|nr:hypothetical protein [Lachnospiraceae bacterium]